MDRRARRFVPLATAAAVALAVSSSCSSPPAATHALLAAVSGLSGSGLVLSSTVGAAAAPVLVPVAASGSVPLAAGLAAGTTYAVAVADQPSVPSQTCAVASGTGTVTTGDAIVSVVCVTDSWLIGGTLHGLAGAGLVLQDGGGDDLSVAAGATTFQFASAVFDGGAYSVSVKTQPEGQACAVANGAGTARADVVDVTVTCVTVTPLQTWTAPTLWGERWSYTPTMVQHAWFDGSALVEDAFIPALTRITWEAPSTGAPPQAALGAFPAGPRQGAGPFQDQPYRAAAASDAAVAALTGDLIVCALVKPHYDPDDDGIEKGIVTRGFSGPNPNLMNNPGGGWVLHQMHEQFCFHYQYLSANCDGKGGTTCMRMIYTPTYFAFDTTTGRRGPLNASYAVFCAGRDGRKLRVAVNDVASYRETTLPADARLDPLASELFPVAMTIGGYPSGAAEHAFPGRIYETAIWSEPATLANLQAKLVAVTSLLPAGATYARNREGPFIGPDGQLHVAWRHGPRVDPAKGMLFGLQSWNRLSSATLTSPADAFHIYEVRTPGEDAASPSWTLSAGATVDTLQQVAPPGDGGERSVPLVTLTPGASLRAPLASFDAPGPILALAWIRPVSTGGQLTLSTDQSSATVDLASYPAGAWSPLRLTGLATNAGSTDAGELIVRASPGGAGPVQFYLWGLDLTQLGGGGDLGSFDPGPYLYDWSASRDYGTDWPWDVRYSQDVLRLPPALPSTATAGFCLSATARPFDGTSPPTTALAWDAAMPHARVAVAWMSDEAISPPAVPLRALLYVNGTADATTTGATRQLCFEVSGAPGAACAPVPAGWDPGSQHRITGCVSPDGGARLFADDVLLAGPIASTPVLDLSTGHVLVGNGAPDASWGRSNPNDHSAPPLFAPADISRPWHGYVARVAICSDPGPTYVAGCR